VLGRGSPGVERRGGAPFGKFFGVWWKLTKKKSAAKALAGPNGASKVKIVTERRINCHHY
jgi:hypothetical protein